MQHEHDYHALAVIEVIDETADTRSFVLDVPSALKQTFAYTAGQFCTFRATIDGETVVRCYSMSSSPDVGEPLTTTVKRVAGGCMSNWMNDHLRAGDTLDVMRPSGLFVLRETDVPVVAFAGGSGITPVISIVKSALAKTERPVVVVYANRDAGAVIFADELARMEAGSAGRLSVHHHLDTERGFLDAAACTALVGDRAHADFYVCGPGAYMDIVEEALRGFGVAEEQVFVERFVVPEVAAVVDVSSTTETLTFTLERRTQTVPYQLGDTILEGARRGGLNPPFSCEMGNCATCMAHLDEGSATMRANNALTADEVETGWVLTCQAIPTSREAVVNYDA
ncbi:MAG: FAD-binding oxidoreductase [Acidimicrobiia bacterium]